MPENIFLDTSVFVKENFLEGKRIKQYLKLAFDGSIQLVLSIITVNEIKAQFRKRTRVALEKHGQLLNSDEIKVLRNSQQEGGNLKKFSGLNTLSAEFNDLLDKKLRNSNVLILAYPVVDTAIIFTKYFQNIYPFNTGEKKHEFPDAFALLSVEEWSSQNRQSCTIFSKDKDFLKATPAAGIKVDPDYEKYLDEVLTRLNSERTNVVSQLFISNSNRIDKAFEEWVEDELDDDSIYLDFTNWLDVQHIEKGKIEIIKKEYEVVSVKDEIIEVEVTATVRFQVVLTIDDENTAIYDSEDKVYHYFDTSDLTIDQELEIPAIVQFSVIHKDDYDPLCEMTEINDGKPIELDKEPDWF